MKPVIFYKMHGCGNDFVFIDNREHGIAVDAMPTWAHTLCDRKFGVGADGLMFLDNTPPGRGGDYIWHFYNADGSRGEMCGNGSRCAAWLAVDLGLAGPHHALGTDAGLIHANVDYKARQVTVELTRPKNSTMHIPLRVGDATYEAHYVDTGVPHLVMLVDKVTDVDVALLGSMLRWHPRFGLAGTNVNFAAVKARDAIQVRTFERGVESETLACGTGSAASVCVTHSLGLTETRVNVTTSGGEILGIELRDGAVFLSGAVARVFMGTLDPCDQLASLIRGSLLPITSPESHKGVSCFEEPSPRS